jgi:NAD kinase
MRRIVVFGGSLNPPGLHHEAMAEESAKFADEVIIFPCGPRTEKETTNLIAVNHRAAMVDLAFSGMEKVRVDLSDLEEPVFTRTHLLQERFESLGEIWHFVGSDQVVGGKQGRSKIQTEWVNGRQLWHDLKYLVINADSDFNEDDLPPQSHYIYMPDLRGRSTEIRRAAYNRNSAIRNMVSPKVADYIERYDLYRGLAVRNESMLITENVSEFLPVVDAKNKKALRVFESLDLPVSGDQPKAILVIGGDGFMLRAIKNHWRLRLPFIGVNAGHVGFLLNDLESGSEKKFCESENTFRLFHLPMLQVNYTTIKGETGETLCFNDAWVERATAQTAWLNIEADGEDLLGQVIADRFLVATAAGSTAYARVMGAPPLLVNTESLLLASSGMIEPTWSYGQLPIDSLVKITALNRRKRPIQGFADGQALAGGEFLKEVVIHRSRIAAVELGFNPERDLAKKISQLQFPNLRKKRRKKS